MGFFDTLEHHASPHQGRTKMDAIFNKPDVDVNYKAELMAALLDRRYSAAAIHRALRDDGFDVGLSALKSFRSDFIGLVKAQGESDE